MKKGDYDSKGFTIIEVVLVLAIAGLIFLMMFIALPALQRQQRDTARKEDVEGLISAVKKYQTNNRGALPGNSIDTWDEFRAKYLAEGFEDPSTGDTYTLKVESCGVETTGQDCKNGDWKNAVEQSFQNNVGKMYIITQAKCAGDENKGVVATSNPRKLAILYRLEGSGLYCADA